MAFTQTEIDTLRAHIARGVRKVEFMAPGGVKRVVEYASIGEMLKALALMEAQVSGATTGRCRLAEHSRD